MTKPTGDLAPLIDTLTEKHAYSSFSAYLRRNFEAFSEALVVGSGDKWGLVAEWAFRQRLTGGRKITGNTAKSAYFAEKKRRAVSAPQVVQSPAIHPTVGAKRGLSPDQLKAALLSNNRKDIK